MRNITIMTYTLVFIIIFLVPLAAWAGNFDHEWFRIFGQWDGDELKTIRAYNIQLRLPEDDPSKGQVSGQIKKIDYASKTLVIGPLLISWSDATRFDKIKPEQLKVGMTLKVSGKISGSNRFLSVRIAPEAIPYAAGSLQITGLSSVSKMREDGEHEFTILNIPVHTPQNGYNTFKSLIRRQDVRRPDDQFKFKLLGKPVTIGGEYDLNPIFRDDFDLERKEQDGSVRLDQELKLEAFYPVSRFTAVFLSFKGITGSRFNLDDALDRTRVELARDETWIFFDRIAGTGFGLQFGNQNVSETREWWWDKDMDVLRLYYNQGPVHFELMGGKQIGGESTLQSISPEHDEVYRVMGLASWMWRSKQRLEFFFLQQWDQSSRDTPGRVIQRVNRDTYDDDMAWFGARAIGELGLDGYGTLNYWVDVAGVHGDERVYKYQSIDNTPLTKVDKVNQNTVNGWAFDMGAFWTLPVKHEPTFTLSYARASGDSDPNQGGNSTFRQTGINRNKWRFNGVNRFRVYGELLRPELSNLSIFTAALGARLLKNSSIELIYHKYDQAEAIESFRDVNINATPNGINKDIGQELDLVMNFREWKRLEIGVIASVFDPGKAFDDKKDLAYSISLDVNYNF